MSVPRFAVLLALLACAGPIALHGQTTFTFGGYVKLDMLSTKYFDGNVSADSPLRDFHFPAAIPVGSDNNLFASFDFHVKESRFNLETRTRFSNGQEIRAYVELDFLLAGQGDERVSNSFNPRLRHFFFTYGKWLVGQTWSTFMVVEPIVDDLDFGGTADGFIFNRQPQLRFTTGSWQFAVENPETTLDSFGGGSRIVTEAAAIPDMVGRYNMSGDWGMFAASVILRALKHEFTSAGATESNTAVGFGVSAGGRIAVGETNDVRFQASAGAGLGRYAAFNFANAAVVDSVDKVNSTPSYLGFVGYRHFWSEHLRTNVNVSAIFVNNEEVLSGPGVNKSAYSASANLLYSPLPPLTFGVELTQGYRQVEGGADGRFVRLQLAGKYDFRFTARSAGTP